MPVRSTNGRRALTALSTPPIRTAARIRLSSRFRPNPFLPAPLARAAGSINVLLSRSRPRLSAEETREQRTSQRPRKQKGWRLAAPAES